MPKKTPTGKATVPWEISNSMFLSEDEVTKLLDRIRRLQREADPEHRVRATVDRLIVEILIYSGLRNSELCQLRVCDTEVGHGEPRLHVIESSKQSRSVYIPRQLSSDIVDFIKTVRRESCRADSTVKEDMQTLILNERGRSYDRTALYRRVVRILTAAGLGKRASVQLLRHTYGFLAYKRTRGNLLFVQQQLGHSHPMVTAVYARFVDFSYAELADNVGCEAIQPVSLSATTPVKRKVKQ